MHLIRISFSSRGDACGLLIPVELDKHVPFAIKRIYTLLRMQPGAVRGAHAHRTLRQVVVALAGSCRVRLDDGKSVVNATLDDPAEGLLLEPTVWHEMSDFSPDCVLLVLVAEHYDESDYIRSHAEFLRLAAGSSA